MNQQRRRKCRNCGELFRPDPRNLRHQRYCSNSPCRQASKAQSQRRWLAKPDNRDYFRGPVNVQRVRAWRSAHPGYWRHSTPNTRCALQELSTAQLIEWLYEFAASLEGLYAAQLRRYYHRADPRQQTLWRQ